MDREILNELVVVKRSGQRVNFNDTKVALAIKKGFDSVYEDYDEKNVNKVKENVINSICKKDIVKEEVLHVKHLLKNNNINL